MIHFRGAGSFTRLVLSLCTERVKFHFSSHSANFILNESNMCRLKVKTKKTPWFSNSFKFFTTSSQQQGGHGDDQPPLGKKNKIRRPALDVKLEKIKKAQENQQHLDPKIDKIFKGIFGKTENQSLVENFIESCLHVDEIKIEKFLNTDFRSPSLIEYKGVVDVLCMDQDGVRYLIEIQLGNFNHLKDRFLYHGTKIYSSQLREGQGFKSINHVNVICIISPDPSLTFTREPYQGIFSQNEFKTEHEVTNKQTHENSLPGLYWTIYELQLFTTEIYNLKSNEERWLYFLKMGPFLKDDEIACLSQNKIISNAISLLDKAKWSPEDLEMYYAQQTSLNVYFEDVQSRVEEGRLKGIEEGRLEGIEEGRLAGIGKEDYAKLMIKDGKTNLQISQVTNVHDKRIRELRAQIENS